MKNVDEVIIDGIIADLTLEEKISMIHGEGLFQTAAVERLGIPSLKMSDGPMGVRKEFSLKEWINIYTTDDLVSYLPSNSALAATWNRDLAYETGKVLGAETRGRGKDVILAPGINIKRSPLCGRNFEYMSEDPKLIEEMVVPLIKGIQENDVAACVKHFVANNQETDRLWVDTEIDEKALREIYFPGFKAAIKQGDSLSIMGAYNLLYGVHCCQSKYLLNEILREEWDYDGVIISDWGGVHDTKIATESALDLEMSVGPDFDQYFMAQPLLKAIRAGEIEEEYINEKLRNILRLMYRLKMLGDERENRQAGTYNAPKHREKALECARESMVLLKNENNRLPLKKTGLKTLAVIGQNAEMIHSDGGGSAEIKALYEISPLLGLRTLLGGNTEITYARGYEIPSKEEKELNWQQYSLEKPELDEKEKQRLEQIQKERKLKGDQLFKEAVALAKEVDEVVFVGGLNHDYDVEGADRTDMKLPYDQDELIKAILEVNPRTVIVMVAGSPVEMGAWKDKAQAIVWSWYAGMEGGNALAEVLFGEVNPSGKLPETFLNNIMDCPAHKLDEFGDKKKLTYKEGIFVGYRYYDTYDTEVAYPFGHGLSYTRFEYDNLILHKEEEDQIRIDLTVKNTGSMDGAEAVQIYISDYRKPADRPIHELKDFVKVHLKAGEEKTISRILNKESFSRYDVASKCFKVEPAEYEIKVGCSSRDVRLSGKIKIDKEYRYF